MKHTLKPAALYWASFNRFELRLLGEAVTVITQPGQNDEAVAHWVNRVEFCTAVDGTPRATPDAIRAELQEYGAWDAEELADDEANRRRIVWCAAHNIAEDDAPDCSEPVRGASADQTFRLNGEATRCGYSDRHAGHIVAISRNGKQVSFQAGTAELLNSADSGQPDALKFSPGGFVGHTSGAQRWKITADPLAAVEKFSLRGNGQWIAVGSRTSSGSRLVSGHSHHYDFNF